MATTSIGFGSSAGIRTGKEEWTKHSYLIYNPLSKYWSWEGVAEKPSRAALLTGCYVLGIAGYVLALPIRVAIFAKEFFHSMIAIGGVFCCNGARGVQRISLVRPLCFLGAAGELFSGLIGLICPPLAYMLDEKIQDNKVIHAYSLFGERKEIKQEMEPLSPVKPQVRRRHISELLRPMSQPLQEAVDAMTVYIKREKLRECSSFILKHIILIGLLSELRKNSNAAFLDPLRACLSKYQRRFDMHAFQRAYRENWIELEWSDFSADQIIEKLMIRAIQDAVQEGAMEEKDFVRRKYTRLTEQLQDELFRNRNFESLYQLLSNTCRDLLDRDKELMWVINQKSKLFVPTSCLDRLNYRWVYLGSDPEDINNFN